mgnify:CR=1 FL=1
MADTPAAQYEDKSQAFESSSSFVKMWLDAIKLADKEEEEWVKKAEDTVEVYRAKKKSGGRRFNILYSNIETIRPALYNSTPSPDVRRRFADPDPVAKQVVDILERALSYSVDSYDFDAVMKAVVHDGELVGRGIPRVRYVPTFISISPPAPGDVNQQAVDPNAPAAPTEELANEEVITDYVPWKYFRRGPARTWKELPWIAFGDFLTREELRKLCGDTKDKNGKLISEEVPLNYSGDKKGGQKKAASQQESIFRQAFVWQVWSKEGRKVLSICPDYAEQPLAMVGDPLELTDFFPVPRGYQPIFATDSLVPIVPYEIYEDLAEELNDVTRRITKLVRQLRPRALYGGNAADMKAIAEADDGEFIPATSVEAFLNNGGLEKALAFWPLEPIVLSLKQLVDQRNEIKQTIYEVTGIADILRGSTSPSETLGAQQLKAQWGSLRIQDRQSEVARIAKDIFRLKAEIIASKFSWETLEQMTGIKLPPQQDRDMARQMMAQQAQQMGQPQQPGMPPQAPPQPVEEGMQEVAESPSREEVEQLLRADVLRGYRVDIESDSTIRGDLTRNQQTMNLFLQGTAQFAQAMAPLIQLSPALSTPVIEVYTAFARQFKLGKQAEDALDGLADKARKAAENPQPPPPDPDAEAAKVKAEADIAKTKLDMTATTEKHGMEMQKLAAEGQAQTHELAIDEQKQQLEERAMVTKAAMTPPQAVGGVQ